MSGRESFCCASAMHIWVRLGSRRWSAHHVTRAGYIRAMHPPLSMIILPLDILIAIFEYRRCPILMERPHRRPHFLRGINPIAFRTLPWLPQEKVLKVSDRTALRCHGYRGLYQGGLLSRYPCQYRGKDTRAWCVLQPLIQEAVVQLVSVHPRWGITLHQAELGPPTNGRVVFSHSSVAKARDHQLDIPLGQWNLV